MVCDGLDRENDRTENLSALDGVLLVQIAARGRLERYLGGSRGNAGLNFGFLGKTSFLDDRQIPDRMKNPFS